MGFKEGMILYSNNEHIKVKFDKENIKDFAYEEWCDDCNAPTIGEKVYITSEEKLISTKTCSKAREQKSELIEKYLGDEYEITDNSDLECTIKEKRRFRADGTVLFFLMCTIISIVIFFTMDVPKIKDFWSISASLLFLVTLYYFTKKETIKINCNHAENRIEVTTGDKIIEKRDYKNF